MCVTLFHNIFFMFEIQYKKYKIVIMRIMIFMVDFFIHVSDIIIFGIEVNLMRKEYMIYFPGLRIL